MSSLCIFEDISNYVEIVHYNERTIQNIVCLNVSYISDTYTKNLHYKLSCLLWFNI